MTTPSVTIRFEDAMRYADEGAVNPAVATMYATMALAVAMKELADSVKEIAHDVRAIAAQGGER